MGAAVFIVLEEAIPDLDVFVNGKQVAYESDALDEASAVLRIRSLFDFVRVSEAEAAMISGQLEGVFDVSVPDEHWFSPSEGVEVVQALKNYASDYPDYFSDAVTLAEDLGDFEQVLRRAEEHKVRWRLVPDP